MDEFFGYSYPAELVRVVDGDTVDLEVDLGFYLKARLRFRLVGIDAPEKNQPGGEDARMALGRLLSCGALRIVTYKSDSFGRWLCRIRSGDVDVNHAMVEMRHAVPYGKPR